MATLDLKDFPNSLTFLPYDTNYIREFLKNYHLKFIGRNAKDEIDIMACHYNPIRKNDRETLKYSFVFVFYNYIYKNKKIPSQDEFYETYNRILSTETRIDIRNEYLRMQSIPKFTKCFKSRIYRGYPSILRDFYLNKLLSEYGYNIIYNIELDIVWKIDTLLIIDDKYYGIGGYVNTEYGKEHREETLKDKDKLFDNVSYIDCPIKEDEHVEIVGNTWLYTNYHIKYILETIEKAAKS